METNFLYLDYGLKIREYLIENNIKKVLVIDEYEYFKFLNSLEELFYKEYGIELWLIKELQLELYQFILEYVKRVLSELFDKYKYGAICISKELKDLMKTRCPIFKDKLEKYPDDKFFFIKLFENIDVMAEDVVNDCFCLKPSENAKYLFCEIPITDVFKPKVDLLYKPEIKEVELCWK